MGVRSGVEALDAFITFWPNAVSARQHETNRPISSSAPTAHVSTVTVVIGLVREFLSGNLINILNLENYCYFNTAHFQLISALYVYHVKRSCLVQYKY